VVPGRDDTVTWGKICHDEIVTSFGNGDAKNVFTKRNPKSEARNPKQIRNLNGRNSNPGIFCLNLVIVRGIDKIF
jgi:hypothetical protein